MLGIVLFELLLKLLLLVVALLEEVRQASEFGFLLLDDLHLAVNGAGLANAHVSALFRCCLTGEAVTTGSGWTVSRS